MREDALLHADQEHDRELEALGRVQRHQDDLVLVAVELVGVGHERHLLEELAEAVNSRAEPTSSPRFSIRPCRLDRVLGLHLGEVAASRRAPPGARRPGPVRASSAATAAESASISSTNDAMPRTAGPVTPASSAWRSASTNGDARRRRYASSLAMLASPTPRLGTLSTRLTLTSSAGLTTARR